MFHLPGGRNGLYLGLIAEQAAEKNPATPLTLDHDLHALPEYGREISVNQLADMVDDMSARMWAAGIRPSEHVVIYKSQNFDIYVLASAAARIGAVPALLSPALDGDNVAALLERLERPYLLTDDSKLDGELKALPLGQLSKQVISVDVERENVSSLAAFAQAPRVEAVLMHADHPALMTHTSGTTGIPKLVVHTPRSLCGRFRPQQKLASVIRKRETYAIHVSYVHSRMHMALAVVLPKGMPVVVMNDGSPEHAAELFSRTKPGFLETHPNSYMEWEELVHDSRRPLANVKYFSGTFDAIHPPTMGKLLSGSQRKNPLFFQFYGQSECGPLTFRWYTKGNVHRADGRCLGFTIPGMTHLRVVSRDGKRPSKETPGLIEVRTEGRAVNYYGEEARFRKELSNDWWRTGDVGYRTRFGCVHLLDRAVDVIPTITSTLEVEDTVLGRLDELSELVLVSGKDKEPVPVVCTKDDRLLDQQRWRMAVADFPSMAEPVQMSLRDLPRTATMKVQRKELTRRLNESQEQVV